MASQRALDSRRLITLANAARKAGILELEVPGEVRFTLGAPPPAPAKGRPSPVADDDAPEVGSLEDLRRRFRRRG